jgi:predicted nucleic acid-binding protein
LVENPRRIPPAFRGVYSFFEKLERGQIEAELSELALFQAFFVLTSHYKIPAAEAAEKLERLLSFRGISMEQKEVAVACMARLRRENIDAVDAWLLAWCTIHRSDAIYSFDEDFIKRGIDLRPIE